MNGGSELLSALARVIQALDHLGIEYFVGGSVASSVFGEPRQTIDADLVARVLAGHATPLVERLSPEFYIDEAAILTAVQNQSSFNVIHLTTMAKVDIFVSWRTPFAQSQFARRERKAIGVSEKLELYFASAEDTVLAKLEWYRKGGGVSDRQWRDLVSVLKVQGEKLDRNYLKNWADRLEVCDLLNRALHDAGLI